MIVMLRKAPRSSTSEVAALADPLMLANACAGTRPTAVKINISANRGETNNPK
jgi:hypothetical protein